MPVLPSRIATTRSHNPLQIMRWRTFRVSTACSISCSATGERAKRSESPFSRVCFAVAAIPEQPQISFTNNAWRFTAESVATRLGCPNISIINDFAAVASAAGAGAEHAESIGGGQVQHSKPMVAIGPGTGTGVACLAFDSQGGPIVLPGEGGHVDFAPITDIEAKILSRLRAQFGRVSIERLLCGAGIMNIYRALADIRDVPSVHLTPEAVGKKLLNKGTTLYRSRQ